MLWVLVSRTLNEHAGLSNSTSAAGMLICVLVRTLWYLIMCFVKFESTVVRLFIWLQCCRIGDKCVVLFLKTYLLFFPLLKFSATSQTLPMRQPTRLPVAHLLHNASGFAPRKTGPWAGHFEWQPFLSTVSTVQNFALWYSTLGVIARG